MLYIPMLDNSSADTQNTCQVSSTFTGRSLLDDDSGDGSFNNSGIRNINTDTITNGGRGRMDTNVPVPLPAHSPNPALKVSFTLLAYVFNWSKLWLINLRLGLSVYLLYCFLNHYY